MNINSFFHLLVCLCFSIPFTTLSLSLSLSLALSTKCCLKYFYDLMQKEFRFCVAAQRAGIHVFFCVCDLSFIFLYFFFVFSFLFFRSSISAIHNSILNSFSSSLSLSHSLSNVCLSIKSCRRRS